MKKAQKSSADEFADNNELISVMLSLQENSDNPKDQQIPLLKNQMNVYNEKIKSLSSENQELKDKIHYLSNQTDDNESVKTEGKIDVTPIINPINLNISDDDSDDDKIDTPTLLGMSISDSEDEYPEKDILKDKIKRTKQKSQKKVNSDEDEIDKLINANTCYCSESSTCITNRCFCIKFGRKCCAECGCKSSKCKNREDNNEKEASPETQIEDYLKGIEKKGLNKLSLDILNKKPETSSKKKYTFGPLPISILEESNSFNRDSESSRSSINSNEDKENKPDSVKRKSNESQDKNNNPKKSRKLFKNTKNLI